MNDDPKNLFELLYALRFRFEEMDRRARQRMTAMYTRTDDKPKKRRGPPPVTLESVMAKMRVYDKSVLADMKIEVMIATFGSSSGTCRAARVAVLAEK